MFRLTLLSLVLFTGSAAADAIIGDEDIGEPRTGSAVRFGQGLALAAAAIAVGLFARRTLRQRPV